MTNDESVIDAPARSFVIRHLTKGAPMKALPCLLALAFAMAVPTAGAQQRLKPGLWEMTQKMQGNAQMDQAMAELQKQLATMPPEQRKQMEAMMAGRGMQMGGMGAGGMSMRVCLTREMVERDEVPAGSSDCKTTNRQRSGNTLKFAFACSNPPSSGESEVTVSGSEAFTSRTRATTSASGKQETVTMEGSGKWLAADCGSVKPIAPPAK
jgi:hypothetical protein